MTLQNRFIRRTALAAAPLVVVASRTLNAIPEAVAFQQNNWSSTSSRWISHSSARPRHKHRQQHTVSHLFFREGDKKDFSPHRRFPLQAGIIDQLKSPSITFPFNVLFDDDKDDGSSTLIIRFMDHQDLKDVLPICLKEFGTGPTVGLMDFPLLNPGRIPDWWDRFYFEPMIRMSLLAKMNANLGQPKSNFDDPAMLVLCRRDNKSSDFKSEKVLGMVELSLQPPEANRNPQAFPIPTWIKELYCQLTNQRIEGWVTNLLIDPRYRGLGYSKILMAATEGVAKSWGRKFIYLHADADIRSGRVAQKLYEGLGYEVVVDQDPQFEWMSGGSSAYNPMSSIRMIEGVALLCYSKQLE